MSRSSRLLLIRGLGHSGTTILDLALGAHPKVVGVGEATRILARPKTASAIAAVLFMYSTQLSPSSLSSDLSLFA